jgi:hypothetical protein
MLTLRFIQIMALIIVGGDILEVVSVLFSEISWGVNGRG